MSIQNSTMESSEGDSHVQSLRLKTNLSKLERYVCPFAAFGSCGSECFSFGKICMIFALNL